MNTKSSTSSCQLRSKILSRGKRTLNRASPSISNLTLKPVPQEGIGDSHPQPTTHPNTITFNASTNSYKTAFIPTAEPSPNFEFVVGHQKRRALPPRPGSRRPTLPKPVLSRSSSVQNRFSSAPNPRQLTESASMSKVTLDSLQARYLTDVEWRVCHAVNIYVYKNGVENQAPILVHIPPSMKGSMKLVLQVLNERVKYPVGYAKTLYKMDGTRIQHPCELEMYNNYVVSSSKEKHYKAVQYGRRRTPLLVLSPASKHARAMRESRDRLRCCLPKKGSSHDFLCPRASLEQIRDCCKEGGGFKDMEVTPKRERKPRSKSKSRSKSKARRNSSKGSVCSNRSSRSTVRPNSSKICVRSDKSTSAQKKDGKSPNDPAENMEKKSSIRAHFGVFDVTPGTEDSFCLNPDPGEADSNNNPDDDSRIPIQEEEGGRKFSHLTSTVYQVESMTYDCDNFDELDVNDEDGEEDDVNDEDINVRDLDLSYSNTEFEDEDSNYEYEEENLEDQVWRTDQFSSQASPKAQEEVSYTAFSSTRTYTTQFRSKSSSETDLTSLHPFTDSKETSTCTLLESTSCQTVQGREECDTNGSLFEFDPPRIPQPPVRDPSFPKETLLPKNSSYGFILDNLQPESQDYATSLAFPFASDSLTVNPLELPRGYTPYPELSRPPSRHSRKLMEEFNNNFLCALPPLRTKVGKDMGVQTSYFDWSYTDPRPGSHGYATYHLQSYTQDSVPVRLEQDFGMSKKITLPPPTPFGNGLEDQRRLLTPVPPPSAFADENLYNLTSSSSGIRTKFPTYRKLQMTYPVEDFNFKKGMKSAIRHGTLKGVSSRKSTDSPKLKRR